jgi:hypothetical protein
VRAARRQAARANPRWVELEEVDLVARGRNWLVSATTDAIYMRHPGVVFQDGSAVLIADLAALYFYVDRDENVVVLERVTSPATWTEHVERMEKRKQRRAS